MGVLIIRALVFRVYIRAPDFWKLPFGTAPRPSDVVPFWVCFGFWLGYLLQSQEGATLERPGLGI